MQNRFFIRILFRKFFEAGIRLRRPFEARFFAVAAEGFYADSKSTDQMTYMLITHLFKLCNTVSISVQ